MSEIISQPETKWPTNPLEKIILDDKFQRRAVSGILESYNSNYDILIELMQNSVDAIEDAFLLGLSGPYEIRIHINLNENWLSVLDTGIGMTSSQAIQAFAPNVSFKDDENVLNKRGNHLYRGYKGVGLTFLAYGTDDITLHTKKQDSELIKGRMQYGLQWVNGERKDPSLVNLDESPSQLDALDRGTFIKIQLSSSTRPKRLASITSRPEVWGVILRTRTAIGQISLSQNPVVNKLEVLLTVTDTDGGVHAFEVTPHFLLPHLVERKPDFKFLDVPKVGLHNSVETQKITLKTK